MGCDIHIHVEFLEGGAWKTLATCQDEDFYDEPYHVKAPEWLKYDDHRSYFIFSILAGVRDHFSRAWNPDDRPIPPISEPKGLPSDATPEYAAAVEDEGPGGHTHSWLTVEEIIAYDWELARKFAHGMFSGNCDAFLAMILALDSKYGKKNARLCFFFDN